MKKVFLILSVLLLSCENDYNTEKCNCNAWVIDDTNYREVIHLELNCNTGQPINLPSNYTFLGCDNDDIP